MPGTDELIDTYTVENWVIEYRNSPQGQWRTLDSSSDDEADMRERFDVWMVSAAKTGMHIRLVKRVAVITDYVNSGFYPKSEEN